MENIKYLTAIIITNGKGFKYRNIRNDEKTMNKFLDFCKKKFPEKSKINFYFKENKMFYKQIEI